MIAYPSGNPDDEVGNDHGKNSSEIDNRVAEKNKKNPWGMEVGTSDLNGLPDSE